MFAFGSARSKRDHLDNVADHLNLPAPAAVEMDDKPIDQPWRDFQSLVVDRGVAQRSAKLFHLTAVSVAKFGCIRTREGPSMEEGPKLLRSREPS